MAFIGTTPRQGFTSHIASQSFSSSANGSTTVFTLNNAVASENDLEVFVGNVRQEPGSGKAYTASGTTLTFTEAPAAGLNVYVNYKGQAQVTSTPLDASISTQKLVDDAVTGAKIAPTITTNHTFSGTLAVPAATSGWRHIKTLSGADVSSVQFLHGVNGVIFDDTYDVYEFIIHYWYATSSGSEMRVEPSQDGSSFTTTNTIGYTAGGYHSSGSNQVWNTNFGATSGFYKSSISGGTAESQIFGGQIRVFSPFDSSKNTVAISSMGGRNNTDYFITNEFGGMSVAGRTHGLQFDQEAGGNIHTKISLYGIKDS